METKEKLIEKAIEEDLSFETIEGVDIACEFAECECNSVLYLEEFLVCVHHGFRLIECLTKKF